MVSLAAIALPAFGARAARPAWTRAGGTPGDTCSSVPLDGSTIWNLFQCQCNTMGGKGRLVVGGCGGGRFVVTNGSVLTLRTVVGDGSGGRGWRGLVRHGMAGLNGRGRS